MINENKEKNNVDLNMVFKDSAEDVRLEEFLQRCIHQNRDISLCGKTVKAEWLYEVYRKLLDIRHKELRIQQQKGIQRALERKEQGNGSYGRPCVDLPDDFEKQIMERIKRHESLSQYRKQLGMKASTFYKWARLYK